GRESRTPMPAGRRPSAFETGGLTTCPGPPYGARRCGLDQVRTGGLRLDGATGTPLPYEAVTGTPPGRRTLTTGVRVRPAGHYVRGVLVGAAGLAPAGHSEAALQAAAFAARPHPQVAGGRGGPTAVFVGISAPVAGLFGVTFSGPVLVPHA